MKSPVALLLLLVFQVTGSSGYLAGDLRARSRPCSSNIDFKCIEDGTCISWPQRCNDHPDCPHGEDEEYNSPFNGCSCRQFAEFRCSSNSDCIPIDWKCNGHADCPGGEDESSTTCRPHNPHLDTFCDVIANEFCYKLSFSSRQNMTWSKADQHCRSITARPAYFWSKTAYDQVVEKVLQNLRGRYTYLWIGNTINQNNNPVYVYPIGTYINWYGGFPETSPGQQFGTSFTDTRMVLKVSPGRGKGMMNVPSGATDNQFGVVCMFHTY